MREGGQPAATGGAVVLDDDVVDRAEAADGEDVWVRTIGNLLWLVIAGFSTALGWLLWAFLFGVTIIGIPFALQCLKLAQLTLWPFGRTVVKSPEAPTLGLIGNVIWFIPGTITALMYVLAGALLCVTIIGIPFGLQAFKFALLAFAPFGKVVVKTDDLTVA